MARTHTHTPKQHKILVANAVCGSKKVIIPSRLNVMAGSTSRVGGSPPLSFVTTQVHVHRCLEYELKLRISHFDHIHENAAKKRTES